MRKAPVVLVSLFIGLSSGYIVPSGVAKIHNASKSVSDVVKKNSTEHNLENVNEINENEIYQTTDDKANNVNERSFILINSKFKKLHSFDLFRAVAQGIYDEAMKKVVSPASAERESILAEGSSYPQRLFKPNINISKSQHHASVPYRYEYPISHVKLQPKKQDQDIKHIKQNLKFNNAKLKSLPVGSVNIVKVKPLHLQPPKKTNYKSDDKIGKMIERPIEMATIKVELKPSMFRNKMRITSFTQRKPNHYPSCGFLKPNILHRYSFLKKHSSVGNNFSPVHVDGANLESAMGNMYDDDDKLDKLERYIKETLAESENQTSDETSKPRHRHNFKYSKNQADDNSVHINEHNSLSKLDEMAQIMDSANIESKENVDSNRRNEERTHELTSNKFYKKY